MPLIVMSFNILNEELRPATLEDWEIRKSLISSIFRDYHVDLAGLQEPNLVQIQDLCTLLPQFKWVGVGLDDGKEKGVFNPIFYHSGHLALKDYSYFFLSQTPHLPSLGWDAYYPRGVTWAKFEDLRDGKVFYHFNTHLDYHGQRARNESAKLLKTKVQQISSSFPYLITGDFNVFSELGGDITYKQLTHPSDKSEALFNDAEAIAKKSPKGPSWSWSGFEIRGEEGVKPDFVFVSPHVQVLSHEIIPPKKEGQYPSDHLPIIAKVLIE